MIKLDNPILEASIKKAIDHMAQEGILFNELSVIEISVFNICSMILLDHEIKKFQDLETEYLEFMGGYIK